jgi:hypothetical protein
MGALGHASPWLLISDWKLHVPKSSEILILIVPGDAMEEGQFGLCPRRLKHLTRPPPNINSVNSAASDEAHAVAEIRVGAPPEDRIRRQSNEKLCRYGFASAEKSRCLERLRMGARSTLPHNESSL